MLNKTFAGERAQHGKKISKPFQFAEDRRINDEK